MFLFDRIYLNCPAPTSGATTRFVLLSSSQPKKNLILRRYQNWISVFVTIFWIITHEYWLWLQVQVYVMWYMLLFLCFCTHVYLKEVLIQVGKICVTKYECWSLISVFQHYSGQFSDLYRKKRPNVTQTAVSIDADNLCSPYYNSNVFQKARQLFVTVKN